MTLMDDIERESSSLLNSSELVPISQSWNAQFSKTDDVTSSSGASSIKNVPQFLNKIFTMVTEPSTDSYIRWSDNGESFLVIGQEKFSKVVLPYYFKTSNFSSFVRQLNMYGFHKVPHMQQGVLKSENAVEILEFSNPHFIRDQPDLLCLVTRKKGGPQDGSMIDLSSIVTELQAIRKHQMTLSAELRRVQQDTEALWRGEYERRQLTEQYRQQQGTLDRVVKFLTGMYGKKKPSTIKKKRKLMLGPTRFEDLEEKADSDDQNDIIDLLDYNKGVDTANTVRLNNIPDSLDFDKIDYYKEFLNDKSNKQMLKPQKRDDLGVLQWTKDLPTPTRALAHHDEQIRNLNALMDQGDDSIKTLVDSLSLGDNYAFEDNKEKFNAFDLEYLENDNSLQNWPIDFSLNTPVIDNSNAAKESLEMSINEIQSCSVSIESENTKDE